jgi:hypothetical protein
MNKQIKKGNINFDQSGRAYPDNPQIKENWDCIWENDGRYYELIGDTEHKEWEEVKVEVRELSMEERWEIANLTPNMSEFDYCNKLCDEYNVPTKAISLTYNNETIESYES